MNTELKTFISEMSGTIIMVLASVALAAFLTLPGNLNLLPGEVPEANGMIARHMT